MTNIGHKAGEFTDISNFMLSSTVTVTNSEPGYGGTENNLDPATVQDNSIQAYGPAATDYIEAGGFKPNHIAEYAVQPGDLISFIASDYGVSVNSILWANNIKDANSIQPGQMLRIPPVSGIIYTVKKDDSAESIAKKYSADASRIMAFNNIKSAGDLSEGREIIIPDGQMPASSLARVSNSIKFTQRFSYLPDLGDYFFLPTIGFDWGIVHGRNGVDVANSCGTSVYAAADGTVAMADPSGWNGGFGKYIKITHPNGTETFYAHLSKILANNGDNAARGELIGLMGTTGRSTGCHLHFEVHGARNPFAKYGK